MSSFSLPISIVILYVVFHDIMLFSIFLLYSKAIKYLTNLVWLIYVRFLYFLVSFLLLFIILILCDIFYSLQTYPYCVYCSEDFTIKYLVTFNFYERNSSSQFLPFLIQFQIYYYFILNFTLYILFVTSIIHEDIYFILIIDSIISFDVKLTQLTFSFPIQIIYFYIATFWVFPLNLNFIYPLYWQFKQFFKFIF